MISSQRVKVRTMWDHWLSSWLQRCWPTRLAVKDHQFTLRGIKASRSRSLSSSYLLTSQQLIESVSLNLACAFLTSSHGNWPNLCRLGLLSWVGGGAFHLQVRDRDARGASIWRLVFRFWCFWWSFDGRSRGFQIWGFRGLGWFSWRFLDQLYPICVIYLILRLHRPRLCSNWTHVCLCPWRCGSDLTSHHLRSLMREPLSDSVLCLQCVPHI